MEHTGVVVARPGLAGKQERFSLPCLASQPDVIFLQELHSTPGALATWKPPAGHRLRASGGSASTDGVGILVAERSRSEFDQIMDDKLAEVIAGCIGGLRLQGPKGCIGLWRVYLATGDAREERVQLLQTLHPRLLPAARP